MSVPANGNMLLVAGEDGPYSISRSVRLRSSASAYLSWTPSTTATSTQKLTYSAWIKRGTLGTGQQHFGLNGAITGSTRDVIRFSNDALNVYLNEASSAYVVPTMLFRDVSAWYHIVVAVDTTQATASNRILIYVNGVQVTSFSSATYPSQNYNFTGWLVSGKAQNLGRSPEPGYYTDGYMAETYVIDGQQLLPTSFGAFDAITGVWNPIQYTGTYGNNGFYLNFKDNTSTTTLGYDYSGNSRHWTANNISLTAGSTYDSMADTPTNYGTDTGVGGTVRGNYCTLSPVDNGNSNILLTNGNISVSSSTTWDRGVKGTMGVSSGKYYYEYTHGTVNAGSNPAADIGWTKYTSLVSSYANGGGGSSDTYLVVGADGNKNNGGTSTSYGSAFTTGDVGMCAIDLDNGKMYWGKNGTWFASGNPAAGTNAAYTGLSGTFIPLWYWGLSAGTNGVLISNINFGQRAFTYTAPSGFKALCTQNLPTPTIDNGANHMAATLYTGTGASQNISNAVNGISFQPDLVWVKNRSSASTSHTLYNTNVGIGTFLQSNTTDSAFGNAGISPILSNGFTAYSSNSWNNASGENYIAWQWKADSSNVTNNTGSITSTVRVNTTAGFSIVTYTGTGATGTMGHGLGVTPSMMIMKKRSAAGAWKVYHTVLGNTKILEMNAVDGAQTSSTYWNNTSPTSTLITVGSNGDINASGETYVSYCWTAIAGYSAFISFTGNGSGDGPFVYCGFRPRWLMIKRYDTTGDPWWLVDSTRSSYNQTTLALRPSASNAEDSGGNANFDFLANGFKARTSGGGNGNESGATYIVAAFAENPFTLARAR